MQNLQFNLIKFEQYIVYNKLSTYVSCKKKCIFSLLLFFLGCLYLSIFAFLPFVNLLL